MLTFYLSMKPESQWARVCWLSLEDGTLLLIDSAFGCGFFNLPPRALLLSHMTEGPGVSRTGVAKTAMIAETHLRREMFPLELASLASMGLSLPDLLEETGHLYFYMFCRGARHSLWLPCRINLPTVLILAENLVLR